MPIQQAQVQQQPQPQQQQQPPAAQAPAKQKPPRKKPSFAGMILYIVVLTLAAIIGYLMYHNFILTQQLNITNTSPADTDEGPGVGFSRVAKCTKSQCLFQTNGNLEGIALLKGYYKEYEAENWDKTFVSCHGLVVTDGDNYLIDHIKEKIKRGNKLNKMIDNELVVNLPLERVKDTELIQDILASDKDKEIELSVVRLSPIGKGESTCSSIIDILSAKPFVPTPKPTIAKVTGGIEVEEMKTNKVILKMSAESEVGEVRKMRVYTDKVPNEIWEKFAETYEVKLDDIDEKVFVVYENEFDTESDEYSVKIEREEEVPEDLQR